MIWVSKGWTGRPIHRLCVRSGKESNLTLGDVLSHGMLGTTNEKNLTAGLRR